MKPSRLFNPLYLYEKRNSVLPYFSYKISSPVRHIQHFLALHNFPVTSSDRHLMELRDRHRGKRCFIIGNGPSLRIQDLNRLKYEITFASNKIYLAFDQTDWRPTYYAIEDPLVFYQNFSNITKLEGFTKLFPHRAKEFVPAIKDSVYFNLIWEDFYPGKPRFGTNALDRLYWGSTITYTCIQLACFMGIREIYLIGVDFHFDIPLETDKENEKIYVSKGEVNHFHPDYRKPGEKWYKPNLHFQEKAYLAAKESVQKLGGSILNATRGGNLKVFPRVQFTSLFEDDGK